MLPAGLCYGHASSHPPDARALVHALHRHERDIVACIHIAPQWQSILSAEDIVQEAYSDLLGQSVVFNDAAALLTFARRLARRNLAEAIHALNAAKRRPHGHRECLSKAAAQMLLDHSAPLQRLELEQRRSALRAALARLPEEHRIVLRLSLIQEMSYRQIGQHLGRHAGWVADVSHRTMLMLRRILVNML
jgi:RNA polymerase sigma factor (sigma-70 family)